jgi:putative transcriptional regulator
VIVGLPWATGNPARLGARIGQNESVESLRGQLLVAAPSLLDPNFSRTVVLIGEHGDEGAMGVVLNRRSDVTVDEAVPALNEIVDGEDLVHVGGPVHPQAIVVLGEFDDPERAGVLVFGAVGFLPGEIGDAGDLGDLARARVFAGYAGWGPGQLEGELAESAWIVEPAMPDDVFTVDPDTLWSAVLRRKGGSFTILATMPPDPSVN